MLVMRVDRLYASNGGVTQTNKDRKKPKIGTDGRSQVVLII